MCSASSHCHVDAGGPRVFAMRPDASSLVKDRHMMLVSGSHLDMHPQHAVSQHVSMAIFHQEKRGVCPGCCRMIGSYIPDNISVP